MAASGETKMTPIESRDELVAYIEQGEKPKAQWRIGTEHEKFPFYRSDLRPVPYEGPAGIRRCSKAWRAGSDGAQSTTRRILSRSKTLPARSAARSRLSLAGSSSFPGAPLQTIFQTCEELDKHLKQVSEIAGPLGISFLGLGFSPLWTLAETPRMPKSRYKHHDRLYAKGWQSRPRHDVPLGNRAG